jgi:hydroxyethylthiazole kinase
MGERRFRIASEVLRMKSSKIYELYARVGEQQPLVHHITNWVTIYDCANVTRTIGALPVMAHAQEEVADMVGSASALVLNIGTLTPQIVFAMVKAGSKANDKGIPVVLDAVGAGATSLRTEKTREILAAVKVNILKGNAGEIATVAGVPADVKGVEFVSVRGDLPAIAGGLAKDLGCTVVVTGKRDIVTNGIRCYFVDNGSDIMGRVVGTGCMAASVIGSFAAVETDYTLAAAAALACFGMAGELAAHRARGPGTFKALFYDELASLDWEKIKHLARVNE